MSRPSAHPSGTRQRICATAATRAAIKGRGLPAVRTIARTSTTDASRIWSHETETQAPIRKALADMTKDLAKRLEVQALVLEAIFHAERPCGEHIVLEHRVRTV